MYQIKKNNTSKGFTLIEMIISLAIFTIVALVATGALLKIMDANRKALTLKTAINNLNFALESMSREMRVGRDYFCTNNADEDVPLNYTPTPCGISSGNWLIVFKSSRSTDSRPCLIGYRYKDKKLTKSKGGCGQTMDSSGYKDILSPDIVVESSSVKVVTTDQPYATFSFKGYAGVRGKGDTEFSMQTRVSQRIK